MFRLFNGVTHASFAVVVAQAAVDALTNTYLYLTPDFWVAQPYVPGPFQAHSDYLKETKREHVVKRQERGQ